MQLSSGPVPAGLRARGQLRERVMNRNERDYAAELNRRLGAGEIAWWAYEELKLRLADNTYYTADFCVLGIGGELEVHEAKGRKRKRGPNGERESYWIEEDANVKLKAVAARFPFSFYVVFKSADGTWRKEAV